MSVTLLQLQDLQRGRRLIVPRITLELPAGTAVGIIGVNGAGKSTMMMAAAGVLRPRACTIDGRASDDIAVGYVPQHYSCAPGLTAREHCSLFGLDFDRVATEFPGLYLDELGSMLLQACSPGQLQALSNAIALALDSELLVMDEPFSALDIRRRSYLREYIRDATAEKPVLLAAQAGADLMTLCGYLVLLRAGHVVFTGTLESLLDTTGDPRSLSERFEQALVQRIR